MKSVWGERKGVMLQSRSKDWLCREEEGCFRQRDQKGYTRQGYKVWQKWDTLRPPSCFNFWNAGYVVVFFHATEWALTPGERMREWAGSSQGFQRKKDKGWEKKCSSGLPLPAAAVCESNPHVLGTIWLQITKCLWNVSAFSRMCGVDSWKMGLERRQGQNYKPYQRAWPWCRPAVFFQFVVCWWLASKLPGVLLIKAGFKCPAQDLRKTHFQGVRHF